MHKIKYKITDKITLRNFILSAMFVAIGYILPLLTGQIKQIGNMLLPMHIPVILCGLICGGRWGLVVGFILPITRSAIFGMPPMYPTAIAMSFELAAYGAISGFLYGNSKWSCVRSLYRSLIPAMIAGRLVWGAASAILVGVGGGTFGIKAFIAGAVLNAIPGIIIQLTLIPGIMLALGKTDAVIYIKGGKAKIEHKAREI